MQTYCNKGSVQPKHKHIFLFLHKTEENKCQILFFAVEWSRRKGGRETCCQWCCSVFYHIFKNHYSTLVWCQSDCSYRCSSCLSAACVSLCSVLHADKLSRDDAGTFYCVARVEGLAGPRWPHRLLLLLLLRRAGESATCVTAKQIGLGMKSPGRDGLIDEGRKGKCGDVGEITTVERETSSRINKSVKWASDIRLYISSSLQFKISGLFVSVNNKTDN